MKPILISINEASKALNLGRTTIYKLIEQGQLETVKIGRRTLVKMASIHCLIEGEG